jgi:hypothetical protein
MAKTGEKEATEDAEKREPSKQENCGECKKKIAIYQCPRCQIRTCSLECCRGHKERTDCSGKRDRGAFLPICRMTDSTVRSDYFFLEEVLNQMPRSRKRTKLEPTPSSQNNNNTMSKKARRLVQQAEGRGITLQSMPTMMERHKSNTSWYCVPRDMITWKLEVIVYPDRQSVSFKLIENEENIMDHVSSHCEKQGVPLLGGVYRLFLKKLPSSAKNPRYVEVHPTETSLKKILEGETVVEHPTIYCVPEEQVHEFPTGSDKIVEVSTSSSMHTT